MNGRRLSCSILAAACVLSGARAFGQTKTVTVRVRVDSDTAGYEGFRAMDGDPRTMWHTDWQFNQTKHPHEITVDLGKRYEITGIGYLPRPGGGNGTIGKYKCYVGNDKKSLGRPVIEGTFDRASAETVLEFAAPVKGRFVRLRALSEVAGQPWTSIAELRILSPNVDVSRHPDAGVRPAPPGRHALGRTGDRICHVEVRHAQTVLLCQGRCHDPT